MAYPQYYSSFSTTTTTTIITQKTLPSAATATLPRLTPAIISASKILRSSCSSMSMGSSPIISPWMIASPWSEPAAIHRNQRIMCRQLPPQVLTEVHSDTKRYTGRWCGKYMEYLILKNEAKDVWAMDRASKAKDEAEALKLKVEKYAIEAKITVDFENLINLIEHHV